MLVQYVRNKYRQKIGVFASENTVNGVVVGWSKCNRRDRFDAQRGLELANLRIEKARTSVTIPRGIREHVGEFVERSKRYFHVDEVVVTGK